MPRPISKNNGWQNKIVQPTTIESNEIEMREEKKKTTEWIGEKQTTERYVKCMFSASVGIFSCISIFCFLVFGPQFSFHFLWHVNMFD